MILRYFEKERLFIFDFLQTWIWHYVQVVYFRLHGIACQYHRKVAQTFLHQPLHLEAPEADRVTLGRTFEWHFYGIKRMKKDWRLMVPRYGNSTERKT